MRYLIFIALSLVCFVTNSKAQAVFELDGRQSMLMTGKGPGQDATINPFQGEDCYAVIENVGKALFSVRIQQGDEIISITPIKPDKKKKIKLLSDQALYLDSEAKNGAKARVSYEKLLHQ